MTAAIESRMMVMVCMRETVFFAVYQNLNFFGLEAASVSILTHCSSKE